MKTVRLFIALALSEEVLGKLKALQEIGREKIAAVRWVDPEKIHLTLVFLGWTDPGLQSGIEEIIQDAALSSLPFTMRLTGLGVFPHLQAPRVIWVGVSEEKRLMSLQERLSSKIASLGLPIETRPFRPHLTLGRIVSPKKGLIPTPFIRWILEGKDINVGSCEVREVVLMKSESRSGGSVYTTLFSSRLGGPGVGSLLMQTEK